MINSLTPEQLDKLPLYKEKWIKIGLSTEPCDVEQSKYWITKAYRLAGFTPPVEWKVLDSPLSCAGYRINDKSVRNRIYQEVEEQVRENIKEQVSQTWEVHEKIVHQLYIHISWQFYWNLYQEVSELDGVYLYTHFPGNCLLHDIAKYDFYLNELKLDCVKPLKPFIELAKHCCWWAPYEEICILTHKPTEIHINSENSFLHNENGPSILYRDGFSVWSLNGVRVDEQIVLHPETQTIEQINEETNEERRRFRIERFGWDRYIELGATIIDSGPNDIDTTHEILARTPIGLRLLTLCPSTGRRYSLAIGDSSVASCLGAQQWLWGNKSFRFVGRT